MYQPAAFREDDEWARELIAAHPLATVVHHAGGELVADHVPLLLDRSRGPLGTLVGHVARANPLWRSPAAVLAVFTGPDTYVTPSWYHGKGEHGEVVPTWNYGVVHAHGTLRAVDDPGTVLGIVAALTRVHEADRREPWAVDDAPAEYVERMLRAIVGIEIDITRLDAKAKCSHTRGDADRVAVAAGLDADGRTAAAQEVRRRRAIR